MGLFAAGEGVRPPNAPLEKHPPKPLASGLAGTCTARGSAQPGDLGHKEGAAAQIKVLGGGELGGLTHLSAS